MRLIPLFIAIVCLQSCSSHTPDRDNTKMFTGYVIGKETCNIDESKDYWLMDVIVENVDDNIGDTLTFDGTFYSNVVKTRELHSSLREPKLKLIIGYESIRERAITSGCALSSIAVFNLREVMIVTQNLAQ